MCLNFGEVEGFLVSFFAELNCFDLGVRFLIDAEAFQFKFYFPQNFRHRHFFLGCFSESAFHLVQPFVESTGASDLTEHLEEASLLFVDQVLDFSLLNYLELARAVQVEPARLKKIEQFFFADVLAIQVVVLPVG